MTGRVLSSADYRLQLTRRTVPLGHALAIVAGAALAAVVVFGFGI